MGTAATLARPYAKAAYAHAVAGDVVSAWAKFLTKCGEIVLAPKVADTFKNPRIEKSDVLTLFLGKEAQSSDHIIKTFRNFIQLLWENQRLPVFAEIAQQFSAMQLQSENIIEAELITAQALNETEVHQIKQQIEKKWDVTLKMQASVDESLLGGALIRIGNRVIDGSMKTQIALLAKALEKI